MKFHEILRQRRLALRLTQEQLAQRLGVSAPAVNKWERNNSYPDITLLPPLARLLEVDLNTLLSFQEELTEEEIGAFANVLGERAQQEGCEAAFRLARDKLREYPNSDLLAYTAAQILDGALVLWKRGENDPEREQAWKGEILALYRRCADSGDRRVRERAERMLISQYDVHAAALFNVFAFHAIEPQHLRIALFDGLVAGAVGCRIVAAAFCFARAAAHRAHIFGLDHDGNGLKAVCEVAAGRG